MSVIGESGGLEVEAVMESGYPGTHTLVPPARCQEMEHMMCRVCRLFDHTASPSAIPTVIDDLHGGEVSHVIFWANLITHCRAFLS